MKEKEFQENLKKLQENAKEAQEEYEAKNDEWWNNLSQEEREDAFYAVVKRIHKAELVDRGTYRWALYDVFGFDPGMYYRGMECGYMELHNSIVDTEETAPEKL